jgi:endonuclease/exonuclease/phosphatase family metal-dependent hydrolase
MDADVVFLSECFFPDGGTPPAIELGSELGYTAAAQAVLARTRLHPPEERLTPAQEARWGPRRRSTQGVMIGQRHLSHLSAGRPVGVRGGWGVVLLSRLPTSGTTVVPLTPLRRDPTQRVVVSADVFVDDAPLRVIGTHFPHLSHGSLLRLNELRRLLPGPGQPGVLLGDLNCFGPPLVAALPGWRRAVRGRTWPAWRPICQPDHILVNRAIENSSGAVMRVFGSDHRPVLADLGW